MFYDDFNTNSFESLFKKPSFSSDDRNQDPISKKDEEEKITFFMNFPSSPFFDDHELPLNQILPQNQIMDHQNENNNADSTEKELLMKKSCTTATKDGSKLNNGKVADTVIRRRNLAAIPRKRSGKKDRHSKISTAQGVRDRRMRLSLQVARKFFDLQDLLGYDKASKTIEWLFNKSKKAIKDITKDYPLGSQEVVSASRTEETESKSGFKEVILSRNNIEAKKDIDVKGPSMVNEKDKRAPRKRVSKVNTRESREKARARARCRTKEKMMIKIMENMSHLCDPSTTTRVDPDKLGSPNGMHQESAGCHNQACLDLGGIEKLLCSANSSSSSSSSSSVSLQISDYHSSAVLTGCVDPNSNLTGFAGDWDLMNSYDMLNSSTTHFAEVTNNVSFAGNAISCPNYSSLFHH